jgi:hypothetical protein
VIPGEDRQVAVVGADDEGAVLAVAADALADLAGVAAAGVAGEALERGQVDVLGGKPLGSHVTPACRPVRDGDLPQVRSLSLRRSFKIVYDWLKIIFRAIARVSSQACIAASCASACPCSQQRTLMSPTSTEARWRPPVSVTATVTRRRQTLAGR